MPSTVAKAALSRGLLQLFLVLFLAVNKSAAFSLVGPYAAWMTPELGYRSSSEIGGPVDITEEYRWNVPVLTFSFDSSFVRHFGSNGIAAVESAFDILNTLPPASSIQLTNYPLSARRMNWAAYSSDLTDVKSVVLSLLVQHLGLAAPSHNVFAWRQWDPMFLSYLDEMSWPPGTIPTYVLQRNFDPETLLPDRQVNGNPFTAYVIRYANCGGVWYSVMQQTLTNPAGQYDSAAADFAASVPVGESLAGLTRDDVGGLRYLLSATNINPEILPSGVHAIGPAPVAYVNLALRPGVEKISFLRQEYDSTLEQLVRPFTNQFIDTYITNGFPLTQRLERVTTQPDLLLTATDCGKGQTWWPRFQRTRADNWWNSRAGTDALGPGVIQPPVRIALDVMTKWASFDDTAKSIVEYPSGDPPGGPLTVRLQLTAPYCGPETPLLSSHLLQISSGLNSVGSIKVSTNLVAWSDWLSVTNYGGVHTITVHAEANSSRFFRLVPQ